MRIPIAIVRDNGSTNLYVPESMNHQGAANDTVVRLVDAYYDAWKRGGPNVDVAKLKTILHPDLSFEGPIAGTLRTAEEFLPGLLEFAAILREYRSVRRLFAGEEAFVLYDCDTALGLVRFSEYFRVEAGRIKEIKLVFDTLKFRGSQTARPPSGSGSK